MVAIFLAFSLVASSGFRSNDIGHLDNDIHELRSQLIELILDSRIFANAFQAIRNI